MQTYVVIDIETTGLNRFRDNIAVCGVFFPEYNNYQYVRIGEELQQLLDSLKANNIQPTFIFQNGKFDTLFIEHKWGITLPIDEDVMILAYIVDMGDRKNLKYLANKYFGVPDWDIPTKQKGVFSEKMLNYLSQDLYWTWRLFVHLKSLLNESTQRVYDLLAMPSYRAYSIVERNGIQLNMSKLDRTIEKFTKKRDDLEAQLKSIKNINWNSTAQVADYLIKECYLPVLKKTPKGAPSIDAKVLKQYSEMNIEVAKLLLEFKYYDKALGTFLLRWKKDQVNGRLHPTFNIDTTRTGRTSCTDPNLQQVPRDLALRTLFTARPGYQFIEADQSQVELRIAAEYAHENNMLNIYKNNGDLHSETAMATTGKKEITKDDRRRAKAVNFGFLYGMSAKKFVEYAHDSYGVQFTLEEATHYRNRFFEKYPNLKLWYNTQHLECTTYGGVFTKFGRFRKLPEIYSSDFAEKSSAERKSINTPVQSTASDILLCGMIEIVYTCPEIYVCGTVHDSILMEVPDATAKECQAKVKHIMEHPRLLKEFGINLEVQIPNTISYKCGKGYSCELTLWNKLVLADKLTKDNLVDSLQGNLISSMINEIYTWISQLHTAEEVKHFSWQSLRITDTLTLSPYQHKAYRLCLALNRAFLFMEQGTGKTPIALTLVKMRPECTSLIVCPKAVRREWELMAHQFFPDMKTEIITSNKAFIPQPGTLYIINYDRMRLLDNIAFDQLILDECHRLKNPSSVSNKRIYELQKSCKYVYGLTGTPYSNNIVDVFGIAKVVDERLFGPIKGAFEARYCNTITKTTRDGHEYPIVTSYKNIDEFKHKLDAISYRVLKKDCLDLKDPVITRLWVENCPEYTTMKKESILETGDNVAVLKSVLNLTFKLQQICSGFINGDKGWILIHNHKLSALIDYILDHRIDQMIIYVTYDMSEKMISERLDLLNIKYGIISGHTKDRDTLKDQFKAGDIQILIIKYKSGTEGLNFQNCNKMIFYDLTPSLIDYEQAKSRIHRRGQERECEYVHLITEHSVEEKIYKALQQRKDFSQYLLEVNYEI